MADLFPKIIEKWEPGQESILGCPQCGATRAATEDEIGLCDGLPDCRVDGCDGWLDWAYFVADHKCPNCGELGFFPDAFAPACSRRCQLQAEYAAALKETA